MLANALGETWPIIKFASQLAEVVKPTALARMLFCMISTGLLSAQVLLCSRWQDSLDPRQGSDAGREDEVVDVDHCNESNSLALCARAAVELLDHGRGDGESRSGEHITPDERRSSSKVVSCTTSWFDFMRTLTAS